MAEVLTTDFKSNAYEGVSDRETRPKGPDRLMELLNKSIIKGNIADELTPEQRTKLGERVCREHDIDKTSRSDWETRLGEAMKIALQIAEKKNYPWPNASNIKYPLVITAAIQFNARAYPAIVSGDAVVKGKPIGNDRGLQAQDEQGPVYQENPETGEPMPVWEIPPGFKRARAERVGRHMSWQCLEEMDEWEPETDKLLVIVPIVGLAYRKTYFSRDKARNVSELVTADRLIVNHGAKSLADAPRTTEYITLYPHEIETRKRKGLFLDVELGPAQQNSEEKPQPDPNDDDAPHTFYEQHRRWDLDGDGYPEPYIVTVHRDTAQVVRIIARFEEDGIETNRQGEVAKIEPVDYYTKYSFIPNPDGGFHDIGFGWLLQPLNESINTTINQMVDAGHLENTPSGLIGGGFSIRGGNQRFRPGEFKQVTSHGGNIRDNVYQFDFKGASPTLFQLLGLLLEASSDITSVKDVMTGEAGPQNEAASSRFARIEQGMKVFTAIYKRIFRSLKQEYKKLYRLNGIYLPKESYFTLHDEPEAIAQQDYLAGDSDVVPVADPASVSDTMKMIKAEMIAEFRDDPYVEPIEARRRIFEAANISDVDTLLREQAPPDPRIAAEADKLDIEKEKVGIEAIKAEADIAKTEAEILKIEAEIEKIMAEAETEGMRPQMEMIKERVGLAKEELKAAAAERAAQRQAQTAKANGSAKAA